MKVSDILRVKGNTLYTAQPDQSLMDAVSFMADKDLGSLVVMGQGQVVGMLTFREVIQKIVGNGGQVGASLVRDAMDAQPLTCTPDTAIDDVRRMMLSAYPDMAGCLQWVNRLRSKQRFQLIVGYIDAHHCHTNAIRRPT